MRGKFDRSESCEFSFESRENVILFDMAFDEKYVDNFQVNYKLIFLCTV